MNSPPHARAGAEGPARPNVDAAEIAHFNRMAQLWWDPHGKMGQLHAINDLRLAFITDRFQGAQPRVVDVGCGGGILAEALAKSGAQVTGIDLSELSLEIARQHAQKSGLDIDYRIQTVEQLAAAEAGTFDVVTCLEMIEHVPDPAAIVRACADLLKPGGWAFFSTISRTPKAFAQAIVAAEYILGLLPRGTHEYLRFIRPSELSGWCRAAGLQLQRLEGLTYNPLTRRYRLTPDTRVNYMLAARKPA